MAHYALLDENNKVIQVITGKDENETTGGVTDWERYYSDVTGHSCKRTSYNTVRSIIRTNDDQWEFGESVHTAGKTPFRGKYAAIGDIYDAVNDVFVAPTTEEEPA